MAETPRTPDTRDGGARGDRRDRRAPDTREGKDNKEKKGKDRMRATLERAAKEKEMKDAEAAAFKAAGDAATTMDGPLKPVYSKEPGRSGFHHTFMKDFHSWELDLLAGRKKFDWYFQEKFFYWPVPPNAVAKLATNGMRAVMAGAFVLDRAFLAVQKLFTGISFPWLPGGREPKPEVEWPIMDQDPVFKDKK